MSAEEGIEALQRILCDSLPQVIVSTCSLQAVMDQQLVSKPSAMIDEYTASRAATALHPRPELQNSYVAPQNPTEQTLANIWSELLGVEKIGRRRQLLRPGWRFCCQHSNHRESEASRVAAHAERGF